MTTEIEQLRASMRAAQPSGKGAYIEDGRHVLQVERAQFKRSLISGTAKESLIVEFKVLASSNPTHEVSSTRAYIEATKNAGWLERFKACLLAILGVDPYGPKNLAAEAACEDIFAALRFDEERVRLGFPDNFLAGKIVHCEGTKGTARGGGPVTNKRWTPYVAQAAGGAA